MTIECDDCDRPSEFHIEQLNPDGENPVGYYCPGHALEAVDHGIRGSGE